MARLEELEPRWLSPNLLAFRCPHCREVWLTVKNAVMSVDQQIDLYLQVFGDDFGKAVVPCNPDYAWTISGTLPNLTITPSIDASAARHWHGFITNGETQ